MHQDVIKVIKNTHKNTQYVIDNKALDHFLIPGLTRNAFYDNWSHNMMVPNTQKEIDLFDKFIASSNEGFFRMEPLVGTGITSFYFTDKGRDFFKALLDL